jgi:hypothetical protein
MSKQFEPNKIYKGSGGRTWVDSRLYANIKKCECKITGEFEDVKVGGKNGTMSAYLGFNGEGTLVIYKIDNEIQRQIAEGFKNGIMPDVKIVVELRNEASKQVERVELLDVVFTETDLASYEAGALIELELPFKFSDYNFLD